MEAPQYHLLPERGGPVNVENDITKSTKPRREPMRSGGETWAVQAGKQPMTPPRIVYYIYNMTERKQIPVKNPNRIVNAKTPPRLDTDGHKTISSNPQAVREMIRILNLPNDGVCHVARRRAGSFGLTSQPCRQ